MESTTSKITSIPGLIAFFKNSKEHLFYVGRLYCTAPLDLHEFMANFEIITCFDPFNGRFPFIKVPESIKNASEPHKCLSPQCQAILLRDPEVISYMRAKSPVPNVFYLMIKDPIASAICKENNFNFWSAHFEVEDIIGNKVKVIEHYIKANVPFIPNVCGRIHNYDHFKELTKGLNTQKIVVQLQNGVSGIGTYFINNKEDYDFHAKVLQNQFDKKIMAFRNLKSFGISAVTGSFGTIAGPIHSEIIGHPKLTVYRAGFCGNEHRNDFFEDPVLEKKIRREIYDITKRMGDYLYQLGIFKGMFGIDFVVDVDSNEVFVMEINPRMTGSMTITFQTYQAAGIQFPHLLYHCLAYMNVDASFDVDALSKEWEELTHYEKPVTHLALKPMHAGEANLPIRIPAGVWKIEDGEAKFTGRFTYKCSEFGEDEYFFLPNHGFSKGNLFMNKRCQDFNRKLTPEVEYIVDRFLELIAKNNHD